jgi:hypothetical protein
MASGSLPFDGFSELLSVLLYQIQQFHSVGVLGLKIQGHLPLGDRLGIFLGLFIGMAELEMQGCSLRTLMYGPGKEVYVIVEPASFCRRP